MSRATERRDPLSDFICRAMPSDRPQKDVYVSGTGPGVIIMAELPGITPLQARFARWIRDAGFTVYLPHLFGSAGAAPSTVRMIGAATQICISRQFRLLSSNSSGPIADWLRALARAVHDECGGRGVGAIGMCVTGNFAVSMMVDAPVVAPVLAEPSLPFKTNDAGLHISPDELAAVQRRIQEENLQIYAYRFDGDPLCKRERFEAYQGAFGRRFVPSTLPDAAANPDSRKSHPHSVFTYDLVDAAGELTRECVDEVIAVMVERLT